MTASAKMSEWLEKIPGTYKVAATLVTVLFVGFTAGAATTPFSELPEKVESAERAIERNTAKIDSVGQEMSEFMENADLTACLSVTDRLDVDWQFCTRKGADWRSLLR